MKATYRHQYKAAKGLKTWDCICPKCGVVHQVHMYWTGGKSSTPRKYCSICKSAIRYLQEETTNGHRAY